MIDFGRVLIAGTGPTAVQMAVLLGDVSEAVAIVGRRSERAGSFFAAVGATEGVLRAEVQNDQHQVLAGTAQLSEWFCGYETVAGAWDTLVLSVSADAYLPVLQSLEPQVVRGIEQIVLMSPTLGSGALVAEFLQRHGVQAEVISSSSYLGDTRWLQGSPGASVMTAGLKRRLHLGSTQPGSVQPGSAQLGSAQLGPAQLGSGGVERWRALHERTGATVEIHHSPLGAESRNMSLYVHAPLFMNDHALRAVFEPAGTPLYVYKLFPEGPITPALIRSMVMQWHELTMIIEALGGYGVNLLEFMLDDGYPVRPQSIGRGDVAAFPTLPATQQEYLVYVRYASLLIDPYSEPDADGRYFDFSGILIRSVGRGASGEWDIPRMPKEDYYRTKIIQGLARQLQIPTPTIDHFLETYEHHLRRARQLHPEEPLSEAFTVQDFGTDLAMIISGVGREQLAESGRAR